MENQWKPFYVRQQKEGSFKLTISQINYRWRNKRQGRTKRRPGHGPLLHCPPLLTNDIDLVTIVILTGFSSNCCVSATILNGCFLAFAFVPPFNLISSKYISTCHGYSPTSVLTPPTILLLLSALLGIPQSKKKWYNLDRYV